MFEAIREYPRVVQIPMPLAKVWAVEVAKYFQYTPMFADFLELITWIGEKD